MSYITLFCIWVVFGLCLGFKIVCAIFLHRLFDYTELTFLVELAICGGGGGEGILDSWICVLRKFMQCLFDWYHRTDFFFRRVAMIICVWVIFVWRFCVLRKFVKCFKIFYAIDLPNWLWWGSLHRLFVFGWYLTL